MISRGKLDIVEKICREKPTGPIVRHKRRSKTVTLKGGFEMAGPMKSL
jgi:hypothetical protein